jgi:hypothetical protein
VVSLVGWDWPSFAVGVALGAVVMLVLLACLDGAARAETEDRWR